MSISDVLADDLQGVLDKLVRVRLAQLELQFAARESRQIEQIVD